MAYNANIPQATDQISQSQLDILNNFIALDAVFAVNHVTYNAGGQGKHAFVEFPAGAAQVTTAAEVGLYSVNSPYTLQPELQFGKQLGSTAPITAYEISSAGYAATGWSRLASGILLKWGVAAPAAAGNTVITFPVAATIPVFSAVYTAYMTPSSAITIYANGLTVLNLTVNASAAGSLYYLVIGV